MDRINELLRLGLTQLTDEQLAELRTLIEEEAARLEAEDATAEVVSALTQLGDNAEALDAEEARRETERRELQERREAALARIRPAAQDEAGEDDEAGTDDGTGEDEGEGAPQAVAAASRPPLRRLAARPRPSAPPPPPPAESLTTVTAATGRPLTTRQDVATAMTQTISQLRSLPAGRTVAVTASTRFPTERHLTKGSRGNDALVAAALTPSALVAAGGLCAPIPNLYEVSVSGTAARPVRDSLPTFGADRGGVALRQEPLFEDWVSGVGTWTFQNDIDAATDGGEAPTKPIIEALCQGFEEFMVEATTARVRFRNVTARFDPEMTQANLDALDIAYARVAENKLLTAIAAQCITVTAASQFSATRDVLRALDRLSAAYRSRHRLDPNLTLNMIAPVWMLDAMRADITAGDMSLEALAVADAMINGWLTDRNIRPTWHLDGRTSAVVGPPAIAAQQFAALVDGQAVPAWPTTVELLLYVPGNFLYLDGGQLDLGVVRDSTLNEVNAYETFKEEFNGLAFRGAQAVRLIAGFSPDGFSAGVVAPS